MNEIRYALRRLARNPGFAVLSAVTLGLGMGANVAVFSVVRNVALEPLPYPHSERLVEVSHAAPGLKLDDINISVPLYLRYREQAHTFDEMGLVRACAASLTGIDVPLRVRQGTVTASLFDVFDVAPLLGRPFSEDDERKEAVPVTLISEKLWRGQFGGMRTFSGAPSR